MSMMYPGKEPLSEFEVFMFVETVKWNFASTMPETPHYYTLKKDCNELVFNAMVRHIRQYGRKERYGTNWYTYLTVGHHKYWTMGWPIERTDLINRAEV